MSKPTKRRAILIAFVTAFSGVLMVVPAPAAVASTWSEGACSTAEGVTVVVDFGSLGGGVHVRCAPGPVGSGFEALAAAGIDYRTALRSPGFLCRIADKPANDPCVNTSPASAYWGYWIAPRGGQWCYSNLGAASRNPPEGTVEGWSFSSGASAATAPPPSIAVPAAVEGSPASIGSGQCARTVGPPASPPTTASPPTQSAPPAPPNSVTPGPAATPTPGPDAEVAPTAPQAPSGSTKPNAASKTAQPTVPAVVAGATTVIEATTTTTPESANVELSRAARRAAERAAAPVDLGGDTDSGGSPLGALAAGGLLLLLGGVAAVIRRRGRERPA